VARIRLSAADIDDPRPDTVIAGRIEADNLGEPFKRGALLVMQVLELDALTSIGTLYILDDGSDVAIGGYGASRPTSG